ncbi:MAG: PIG-L family deacetylase, partial [Deltaproteobacteria bacterium]|nr:PIG-L family deacetylase [Deltaproteobacteria bacterium]
MNVLAIGAHPDDVEFGCSGTLIKYVTKGANVYLLVLSEGSFGGNPGERKREQMESARVIGAKDVFWGGYEDTRIPISKDLIDCVEHYMAKVEPDFIFV